MNIQINKSTTIDKWILNIRILTWLPETIPDVVKKLSTGRGTRPLFKLHRVSRKRVHEVHVGSEY